MKIIENENVLKFIGIFFNQIEDKKMLYFNKIIIKIRKRSTGLHHFLLEHVHDVVVALSIRRRRRLRRRWWMMRIVGDLRWWWCPTRSVSPRGPCTPIPFPWALFSIGLGRIHCIDIARRFRQFPAVVQRMGLVVAKIVRIYGTASLWHTLKLFYY